MEHIAIPSPPTMEKGDIIFRHQKANIGVGGIPFVFNIQESSLRWADDEIDPEDILSLARRLHAHFYPPQASSDSVGYAGASGMDSEKLNALSRDIKFSGVSAWISDQFGTSERASQAQAILDRAKAELVSLSE